MHMIQREPGRLNTRWASRGGCTGCSSSGRGTAAAIAASARRSEWRGRSWRRPLNPIFKIAFDGVGGGLEWGLGTVAVSIITFSEVADDGFLGLALALVGEGVGHLA